MKEHMFLGCYVDGERNMAEGVCDDDDVLGELQEEEIMWGEPVTHQKGSPLHKEPKAAGAGRAQERKKVMMANGGGHEDADGYCPVQSRWTETAKEHQQSMGRVANTWAGGDAMSAALGQKKGAMRMLGNGNEQVQDEYHGDGDDGEGEGRHGRSVDLPPHELLARQYAATFSVLHGAGRTLKGMDLRRLRNEVWRQTGFID